MFLQHLNAHQLDIKFDQLSMLSQLEFNNGQHSTPLQSVFHAASQQRIALLVVDRLLLQYYTRNSFLAELVHRTRCLQKLRLPWY